MKYNMILRNTTLALWVQVVPGFTWF